MNQQTDGQLHFGGSLLGIGLAVVVWLAVAVIGHTLLYLLDWFRGLAGDVLQDIFRQLFMPGVGGFAGIAVVHDRMTQYNRTLVFYGFCLLVALLVFGSLAYVLPVAKPAGINTYDLVIHFLSGVASLVGAYIARVNYWKGP